MHLCVGTLQYAGKCLLSKYPFPWGSGPLGPTLSQPPNGISIGLAVFCTDHSCAEHTDTADRQTDRHTARRRRYQSSFNARYDDDDDILLC